MVFPTFNADPAALAQIKVQSAGLKGVLPTLAIGEIIRVTVRSRDKQGRGMLGIKGSLIPANLPENVSAGDRLLAQIDSEDGQVILKLISQQTAPPGQTENLSSVSTTTASFNSQLRGLLTAGQGNPFDVSALDLSSIEKDEELSGLMTQLFSGLAPQVDQGSLYKHLQSLISGKYDELAKTIKVFEQKLSSSDTRASLLLKNISEQLTLALTNSYSGKVDIEALSKPIKSIIAEELKKGALPKTFTDLFEKISNILTSSEEVASEKGAKTELSIKSLQQALILIEDSKLLPKETKRIDTLSQLQQLSQRLVQLDTTLDLLSKMNPALLATEEPALLLIPLFFPGLFATAEVIIDPEESSQSQSHSSKKDNFRRLEAKLPLSGLGIVEIHLAYSENEVFLNLYVEDESKQSQLEQEVSGLADRIKKRGIEKLNVRVLLSDSTTQSSRQLRSPLQNIFSGTGFTA